MSAAPVLPADYFETRFRADPPTAGWPGQFAIVTAWAPTGQRWSDAANAAADEQLRQSLRSAGLWHHRITGYSPHSAHAEPGWAIALAPAAALKLGTAFLQHAVYTVTDDQLQVLRCEDGYSEPVGRFLQRLDAA